MSDKPLDCVGFTLGQSDIGKHDFVLTERTPEGREAYQVQKISELIAVTRERDALKAALTWYADPQNYDWEGRVLANADAPRTLPPLCDRGGKARDALKLLKAP